VILSRREEGKKGRREAGEVGNLHSEIFEDRWWI